MLRTCHEQSSERDVVWKLRAQSASWCCVSGSRYLTGEKHCCAEVRGVTQARTPCRRLQHCESPQPCSAIYQRWLRCDGERSAQHRLQGPDRRNVCWPDHGGSASASDSDFG